MWYIIYNGQQVGPLQKEQLPNYNLTPESMVWCEGMSNWQPAGTIAALADLLTPQSYGNQTYGTQSSDYPNNIPYGQQPYYGGQNYPAPSGKSKVAAGVLAILLGGLGVQYFYLGKVGGGFLTILLSLVTCGAWEIITLIQGILMLCMSDEEFDRKFVYTKKTFPLF
ncbi:MAG: GYF domain-containing protein [Muribaculaceae bacterium]|nr:GYF domain-containing protein [Muribaculaceae bacterium]